MKKQFTIMLLSTCILMLAGCDSGQKSMSRINIMHSVQLLVDQALITAAHGANLKLETKPETDAQGQVLLADASSLLRRALSGPEMAMMHKGEHGMPAGMKQTHDMGDTAFDLIELMMALTPNAADAPHLHKLNDQLAIAASAHSVLLQAKPAGDLKSEMRKKARKLLNQANQSFANIHDNGAYHVLVGRLLEMLQRAPDKRESSGLE